LDHPVYFALQSELLWNTLQIGRADYELIKAYVYTLINTSLNNVNL